MKVHSIWYLILPDRVLINFDVPQYIAVISPLSRLVKPTLLDRLQAYPRCQLSKKADTPRRATPDTSSYQLIRRVKHGTMENFWKIAIFYLVWVPKVFCFVFFSYLSDCYQTLTQSTAWNDKKNAWSTNLLSLTEKKVIEFESWILTHFQAKNRSNFTFQTQ